MALRQKDSALPCLDRLLASRGEDLPDGYLLERFALLGDESAFTILVRRHGSLVLGACRRVLHNSHDADDCFQATFLVLARKARSLSVPQTLAPWLYSVAVRTALKARGEAGRRRQREEKAARPVAVDQPDELLWRDLWPVLDAAVRRLPSKYRDAFVLCCLEGSTVAEAARRLGCPQGTAAARLARAKERLRAGLSRRGVTLGAAALSTALSEGVAAARLPARLVSSAVTVAGRFATRGAAAVGAEAIRPVTAQGIVEATHMTKTRKVVALLLLLAGAGAVMRFPDPASGDPPMPTVEQAPVPQGPRVRFLSLAEALALARRPAVVRREVLTLEGERVRNEILMNVEVAYWDLYAAYWNLHSREQGLRLMCWKTATDKGRASASGLARIRGQYELFHAQRLAAKQGVAKAEGELRKLLSLRDSDGTQLVPCDAPTLAEFRPDWEAALRDALTRPELRLAGQRLAAGRAGQFLAPAFSAVPGAGPLSALAATRVANLRLGFAFEGLKAEEIKTEQFLALNWRRLMEFHEQVRAQRAQREAYSLQLRLEVERVGEQITADDTVISEAQRFYTDALANEYEAAASYAKVQCQFAFARGTILEYDRHRFGSDLVCAKVGKQSLERERKRTRSLVLHASAREAADLTEARTYGPPGKTASGTAISLPALWKAVPPLKEVGALLLNRTAQSPDCPVLVPYSAAELFPQASH